MQKPRGRRHFVFRTSPGPAEAPRSGLLSPGREAPGPGGPELFLTVSNGRSGPRLAPAPRRVPGEVRNTKLFPVAVLHGGRGAKHGMLSRGWVPEGSLAGFFGCRIMAVELVCKADFSCKLICGAGPGDLEGSRGSISIENPGKTGPKISSQTAFKYPGMGVSFSKTADIATKWP